MTVYNSNASGPGPVIPGLLYAAGFLRALAGLVFQCFQESYFVWEALYSCQFSFPHSGRSSSSKGCHLLIAFLFQPAAAKR